MINSQRIIDQGLEIAFNREIAPGVFYMGLRSPLMASESRPGQFVMVRVGEGIDPLLRRPISLCGASGDGLILLLYKTIGRGTSMMAEKKAGECLSVMGPLGRGFEIPEKDERAILVAGGMGTAPLCFLADRLKGQGYTFMAGFGSSRDIIPFGEITGQPLDIALATDDGTTGYAGFVTGLLEALLDKKDMGTDLVIYTCGPVPMMKKAASIASAHGIRCNVSLEALMACGLGACQGCAIRIAHGDTIQYRHVCKDGPVFPSQAVDWSAL
jgi:dihydroorotate dehydrogenase electron transfer subunit